MGNDTYDEIMDRKGTDSLRRLADLQTRRCSGWLLPAEEFVASLPSSSSFPLVVMEDLTDAWHFHSLLCDSR